MRYDVAVAGLGGMGSAILAHCAARGSAAIGIEQFEPAHQLGSSGGRTRLIRKAYFEDAAYVPLILRAYDLWHQLEHETGEHLLRTTGLLTVGQGTSAVISGTLKAARLHRLAHEELSRAEVSRRYPMLQLRAGETAIFEPDAGALDPERAIRAHLQIAAAKGATAIFGTAIVGREASASRFILTLADGQEIFAAKLVVSLGPWLKTELEALGVKVRVQRNVQAWFDPADQSYEAGKFPSFFIDRAEFPAPLYGFPDLGDGVKAAFHGYGEITTAPELRREIDPAADIAPLASALEAWMPGAAAHFREAKVCMYTLTPDEHFVVDRHPALPNLILCGGFSGHGFKFAPVIGEIAAELALEGRTRHEIGFLGLRRFRA